MSERIKLEYFLLRYLPTVTGLESVPIAAIFLDPSGTENGICTMRFSANWQKSVLILDPDGDLEILEALLSEIRDRLLRPSERSEILRQLEDSFSNVVQVSERQPCYLTREPGAIETFARILLDKTEKSPATCSSVMSGTACQA